jgi:hypothetical protein
MTIFISIENDPAANRAVSVSEPCGDPTVQRDLQPGESARIAISRPILLSLSEVGSERLTLDGRTKG